MRLQNSNFSMDENYFGFLRNLATDTIFAKGKGLYSLNIERNIKMNPEAILAYFTDLDSFKDYYIENGQRTIIFGEDWIVVFGGKYRALSKDIYHQISIIIQGERTRVEEITDKFLADNDDLISPTHHGVSIVMRGSSGLTELDLPVKLHRKIIPEMYPQVDDINEYIRQFLASTANVLILTGEPGMGKSALINEIILQARKTTKIAFDIEVMKMDQLYTDFISESLNDDGGMLVLEDADDIISDRSVEFNTNMTRLLNLSDGIVDTSGAKFIFSANLKDKTSIDSALIRPGRCFDILEFKPFNREEAERAAKAVGVDIDNLVTENGEYTVAEIYNGHVSKKEKKRKVGFL